MTQFSQSPAASREQYIELLNEITEAALTATDFRTLLQTLADRLAALFAADACHIALWDEISQLPRPAAAFGPVREQFMAIRVRPGQKTLTAAVLQSERVLAISNVAETELIDPAITARFSQVQAVLGLPLMGSGKKFGAALLLFTQIREFSDRDLAWAGRAAAQISLAVARSQLLETERTQRELAETLREVSRALSETLDLDALLDRLLTLIARVVPYDSATIMRIEGGTARVVRHRGFDPEQEQYISELVLELAEKPNLLKIDGTGVPLIIPNVVESDEWVPIEPFDHIGSWAGVPVTIDAKLVWLFSLDKKEPDFYQSKHLHRMEAFADQAALSLSNALLHSETRRQLNELKTLRKIALIGATALTEDELIEKTTRVIGETLYPDNFGFLIYDKEVQALRPHSSYRPEEVLSGRDVVSLDECVAGQVFLTGQPRRIMDVRQEPAYLNVDGRTRSELCVPLQLEDRVLGVINTESARLNAFTDADERLLVTLAGQIATAVARIRLFTAERARRQEAETLREAIAAVNSSLELDRVLDSILVQLNRVVPYDSAALMLLEEKGLKLVAGRGFPNEAESNLLGQYFAAEDPLVRQLRKEKRPILLIDAQADSRFHSWGGTTYIRGWMGLPLIVRGHVIGFLTIDNQKVGAYREPDMLLAQSFAHQAATAIENARLYQATEDARSQADRRTRELRVTAKILELLNATPDVAEIFPRIAAALRRLTQCRRVSLALIESQPDSREVMMAIVDQNETTLGQGVRFHIEDTAAAEDILAKRPHLTPDLLQETDYPAEALLYRTGVRSRINLPLVVREEAIGALNLTWAHESGYDPGQLPLLMQICSATALAVERTRLFTTINQHTEELEILIAVSTSLRQAANVKEMLPLISETISQVTSILLVAILFLDPESAGDLIVEHQYPPFQNRTGRRVRAGTGVTGHVVGTGEVYVTDKLAEDPHVDIIGNEVEELKKAGGSITLPLRAQERIIGVIHIILPPGVILSESTQRLLVAIAEIAGSALDRANVLETLEQRVATRTQELAAANEQLQELDRLKSKFVSDVSHELRTPVTNLRLYLDLLARGHPERREHYVGVLRQQADRLSELIEDILNLSRLEMSGDRVKFAPVDLNNAVQKIVNMHLPRIEAAGLHLEYSLQPDLPRFKGERNQVIQVITNLLENAIRYTHSGSISIETGWDPEKKRVYLTVEDTGVGIYPDEQAYIFDRFYRGRFAGQSNIPGTGLGLAIVKEIVDLHEGNIVVKSQSQGGSAFQIWFPL